MVLICPKCETRLQLDETKTPSQPFKVRCPKCQASVSVPLPGSEPSDAAQSSSENPIAPYERPVSAPAFNPSSQDEAPPANQSASSGLNDVAQLLVEALRQASGAVVRPGTGNKSPWERSKALVCSSPAYREAIARSLAANNYEVFVAENMAQALGRMREERMDVVVLDANFDPLEQGVAFVTREVKLLRPSERRRLFLVYLTSGARTMDLHAAFLHNVNLVVNPSDLEQLPEALEVSTRHYNELYREFNRAFEAASI